MLVAGLLWAADIALAAAQPPTAAIDSSDIDVEIDTAPVAVDGHVLLRVRGASSYPAHERAARISKRIEAAAADTSVAPGSVRAVAHGDILVITAGEHQLMAITGADARLEALSREDLARLHVPRIAEAVVEYRAARSAAALRQSALRTAGSTVGAALLVALLVWMGRGLERVAARRLAGGARAFRVRSVDLVGGDQLARAARGALRLAVGLAIAAVALGWLDYALRQFPWTRGLSIRVLDLLLDPLTTMGIGLLRQIPNLMFLLVLFIVVRIVLRAVRLYFDALGRGTLALGGFESAWAEPTYKLVRLALLVLALVVAYPYIPGSHTEAFKGISILLGVLLSIGSSSAIANVVAGYMITYRRAFRIGDRVKIGDVMGDITHTRLQVTHLRTPKNEEVTIPNAQILGLHVVNYSALAKTKGLIVGIDVSIGYEVPWRQVEAMLLLAAARTQGARREPAPFVHQRRLGDFAIGYELNVYSDDAQAMNLLKTELHGQVLDVFNEHGVQIMTPAYESDPEMPKVVAKSNWFEAPASRPPPNAGAPHA
ncbi:MAG TPA: mechanosensitive ion channel [Burkholderiaceae bacterium]|nr:mechanosensitive ion channel [Burkholderiaceae bacterium]